MAGAEGRQGTVIQSATLCLASAQAQDLPAVLLPRLVLHQSPRQLHQPRLTSSDLALLRLPPFLYQVSKRRETVPAAGQRDIRVSIIMRASVARSTCSLFDFQ
jgi:hypothetical protein